MTLIGVFGYLEFNCCSNVHLEALSLSLTIHTIMIVNLELQKKSYFMISFPHAPFFFSNIGLG
jgi:hypothetical protein